MLYFIVDVSKKLFAIVAAGLGESAHKGSDTKGKKVEELL